MSLLRITGILVFLFVTGCYLVAIPALMVTNTAFYRNTAYHTPRDTADRLDYERMGMVVVGVYEAIRNAAAK